MNRIENIEISNLRDRRLCLKPALVQDTYVIEKNANHKKIAPSIDLNVCN